jgi:YidC/Oxa1 family membrane protein insertase
MYDRKTWVILALCGTLLAVNLYYGNQQAQEAARLRAIAEQKQRALTPPPSDPAIVPASGLSVEAPPPPTEEETTILENDEVIFTFTNIGGGIKHAEFKKEFQVGSQTALVKHNQFGAGPIGGLAGPGESLENVAYSIKADESIPGSKIVYITKLSSGLIAKKTFSLIEEDKPGSRYLLNFDLTLDAASTPLNINQWSIFLGEASPLYQAETPDQTGFFWHERGDMYFKAGTGFKGGMFSSAQSLLKSSNDGPLEFAGVTNQFFATVLRPLEPVNGTVWAKHSDIKLSAAGASLTSVNAGLQLPSSTVNPGNAQTLKYRIFIGPKHNPMLRKMEKDWGAGWGDVMQYGSWMQWSARPLNSILNFYHTFLDKVAKNWSWGLAVIFLTITVRIAIWPLHAKSTHTMKKMAQLQPEMAKIKEKYPDDPNKVNTETMGLYKKYGINPLGGCLPMLLQIPIFFGFYKMLQYAVELRGHSFLWVHDLSQPDTLLHIGFLGNLPLNILPIVMAITSFLQIRMTPKTGDPMQQKIIMFMPFIFFFFCYNFASALALYWTTQNIFSIGQTWLMNKVPEPKLVARTGPQKQSWMQRMAAQQAEAQKAKSQGTMRNATPESKKKRPPRTGG